MEIIYRAFDGKNFESEDECIMYENEKRSSVWKNEIIGFDSGMNQANLEDGFDSLFRRSFYIVVKTEATIRFLQENKEELGSFVCDFCEDCDKPGCYFYDDEDKWKNMDDIINDYYKEIERLDRLKKRLWSKIYGG